MPPANLSNPDSVPAASKAKQPRAVRTPAKTATPAEARPIVKKALAATVKPASEKLLKPRKVKLVRDNFTMPKLEYLMLEALKLRAGALGSSVKKNELIRAGIKALAAMPDSHFSTAIKAVQTLKTGHPAKD